MRRIPLHSFSRARRRLRSEDRAPRRRKTTSTRTRASGPDSKRSSAQQLDVNKPHTDEVSYMNQDKTDWYQVELKGKSGVLDHAHQLGQRNSDINIDVFDAFGAQIAASPVRGKGEKQKKLFTQIDKPGTYFMRVTAPAQGRRHGLHDGGAVAGARRRSWPPPIAPPPPAADRGEAAKPRARAAAAARDAREAGRRDDPGARGSRLSRGRQPHDVHRQGLGGGHQAGRLGHGAAGSGGEDPLDGGSFKIVKVIDANKCVGVGVAALARQEQPRGDHAGSS